LLLFGVRRGQHIEWPHKGPISRTGVVYPTPSNQCWPGGVPYVFWNIGMQMLQQKDAVTILYINDRDFRHVRLNAQHPAHVTPSWYGDSVGHYEGDMLVIDTVGIKNAWGTGHRGKASSAWWKPFMR